MSPKTKNRQRNLRVESLEHRRVMAASLGWDGPGLGSATLTYNVANSPSSLTQAETDAVIKKAFDVWSDVADIEFVPTSTPGLERSIDISFGRMDGPGGTLAQAYFPDDVNPARIAGDIQFDTSDNWEVGNSRGSQSFDLLWVAVHEIGHSLGLDHSDSTDSVMADSVSPNQEFLGLSTPDIAAIQSLYAAAPSDNASDPPPSDPPVAPENPTTPDQPNDQEPNDQEPNDQEPNDQAPDSDLPPTDNPSGHNPWFHFPDFELPDFGVIPSDGPFFEVEIGNWIDFDFDPWMNEGAFWWESEAWGVSHRLDVDLANHNLYDATDANDDGVTSTLDALIVINQINSNAVDDGAFSDVNADGMVTPADALAIINSFGADPGVPDSEFIPREALQPSSYLVDRVFAASANLLEIDEVYASAWVF